MNNIQIISTIYYFLFRGENMYDEIMKEIKSNLSGNPDKDRIYLVEQMENYKNHEYGQEIVRELARLMWDCLSDEEKEAFARASDEENYVKDAFDEAYYHVQNQDLETALNKLDSFFNSYSFGFQDDKVNEYHSFSNPIEEILFRECIGTDKEIRFIPPDKPYENIHYLYGSLLIEFGRLDDAEAPLDYALKLNPVNCGTLFERAEIFKSKKDFKSFLDYTIKALEFAYSSQSLARAYRNLGFYFIEKENFELATALFNYSLSIELNPMAFSELEYMKRLGQEYDIDEDRAIELLRENNIQIGPNPLIFNILAQLIIESEMNQNYGASLYFYNIYYDLTEDEEVLEKINDIESKLE